MRLSGLQAKRPRDHPVQRLRHFQSRLKLSCNTPDKGQCSFSSTVRECISSQRSQFHFWAGTSSLYWQAPPLHTSSIRKASDRSNFFGNRIILWHCFHLMSLKTLKLFSHLPSSQVSPFTCPTSFQMEEPTVLKKYVISLEWSFSEMRPLTGQWALLHGQRH